MKTLGGILALLVVLTGCTGGDGGSDKESEALKRDKTVVKPTWTANLELIGQPKVAGDAKTGFTVVAIAKEPGRAPQDRGCRQ